MPEYLFVYGTLRQALIGRVSNELQALMQSLRYVGQGRLHGELYDLGIYPGAIVGNDFTTLIVGEVYEMPDAQPILEILDVYEGFVPGELEASLYARQKETVLMDTGQPLQCWLYVYNDWVSTGKLIPEGDYVAYLESKVSRFQPVN